MSIYARIARCSSPGTAAAPSHSAKIATFRIWQVPLGGLALGVATCLSAPLCWPAAIRLCWPARASRRILARISARSRLILSTHSIAGRAARRDLRRARRRVAFGRSILADRNTCWTARRAVRGRRNAGATPAEWKPRLLTPPLHENGALSQIRARFSRPAPPCCCADVPSTWQALLGPLLLGTASARPWTSTAAPALAALACVTVVYVSSCRPATVSCYCVISRA